MGAAARGRVLQLAALLVLCSCVCSASAKLQTITRSIQYKRGESFVLNETIILNNTMKYIYNYTFPAPSPSSGPARITVEGFDVTKDFPVIVVVWHEKGVMSWQIPFTVGDVSYSKVSRIICPENNYNLTTLRKSYSNHYAFDEVDNIFISMTTAATENVTVRLSISTEVTRNFFLRTDRNYTVPPSIPGQELELTPSEPWYFQFNWPIERIKRNITSVLLHVESKQDHGRDICMTLSIQPISCPVLDTEWTVGQQGYWQTLDWQGGVLINKDSFPNGFYAAFILNGDDSKCTGMEYVRTDIFTKRVKTVTFRLYETVGRDKYVIPVLAPVAIYGSICVLFFIGALIYLCRPYQKFISSSAETTAPHTSQVTIESEESRSQRPQMEILPEDDIGVDTIDRTPTDVDSLREKKNLFVCDLAKQDAQVLRRKSNMYVLQLFTVAVFYSLPVVQLMLSYQVLLNKTGNTDTCYYNFLCAHPLDNNQFSISDFNHVFSNIGYVMLGLLFCGWTARRDTLHRRAVRQCPALDQSNGIPQHYGFFYAIGWALVMEGFLSASYHICPNQSNFQFDTSFMYIMAVLCMVKLYHNRHPDINASAYTTFMVLALIIFFGMVGILESSPGYFIFISVIHLLMCVWLSVQVYNLGRGVNLTLDKSLLEQIKTLPHDVVDNPREYFIPKYPNRLALLTIGIVLNASLVFLGWQTDMKEDFGSYLLTVLLANLMLYFMFYIIMKVMNGERLLPEPLVYSVIALCLAVPAAYFFYTNVTSWQFTAAKSRRDNQKCLKYMLDFYDNHDVWHFLSAGAMFSLFMVLLTLDDDLINVPRSRIPVF